MRTLMLAAGAKLSFFADKGCTMPSSISEDSVWAPTQVANCYDVTLPCGAGSRVPGECTGSALMHIGLQCGTGGVWMTQSHYGTAGCAGAPQYTVPFDGFDASAGAALFAGECAPTGVGDLYAKFDGWTGARPDCPAALALAAAPAGAEPAGAALTFFADSSCTVLRTDGAPASVDSYWAPTQVANCYDVTLPCGAGSRVPGECTGSALMHIGLQCGPGGAMTQSHYGTAGCAGAPQYTVPFMTPGSNARSLYSEALFAGECADTGALDWEPGREGKPIFARFDHWTGAHPECTAPVVV